MPLRWGYEITNKMDDWTPPPHIPHDGQSDYWKRLSAERAKLSYLSRNAGAMDTSFDTELDLLRKQIAAKSSTGVLIQNLGEDDLADLARRITTDKANNARLLAESQTKMQNQFPMSRLGEITAKWEKKARGLSLTNLSPADRAKYDAEIAKFKKGRAQLNWNLDSYKQELAAKLIEVDFAAELDAALPADRDALVKEKLKEIKDRAKTYDVENNYTDPEEGKRELQKILARDKRELESIERVSSKYKNSAGSYTGESKVEVAVRKTKEAVTAAAEKTKKAGAAVKNAGASAGQAVKNAAVGAIPGTGPAVSPPSPLVRPTTTNAVPSIPDMGGAGVLAPTPAPPPAGLPPPPSAASAPAPAASTPPPSGLPRPPSAAPAPAASTPPPANLPTPPSASAYPPLRLAGKPPTAPPAGQGGYPPSGNGGVVGVGEDGITVRITGDLAAGRKWTPRVRPSFVAPDARPAGLTTGAPYGTTSPLTPTAGNAQSGKPVTDATGQTRVGFVSSPTAPKPTGRPIVPAPPVQNPSILAELVGPVTESAKMIGGLVGKGTVDVVVGAANLIKKAVVPTNPRDILRGNQPAKPATPAPAKPTATTEADKLPRYAYGYDPATGKQTGGPATKATYGDMGRRVSSFRDNLIPYLNGRNAAELRGELAGKHGAYDLETFLQKAANRSGMFTASEVGQVVQQLKSDPMFKGLVDAGLPVDAPKGPFKAGGAPKKEIKDAQGNVLPKGNSVPKATPPPTETAADRLAKIRAAEAQRIAAEQAAETKRVAEATAAWTEEQKAAAVREAERKALIKALQDRSPAGTEPAFPAGTRFGAGQDFVGNSGLNRWDRLKQIAIENKNGVTADEVMLQRWLKSRTATSTPESRAATGKPAPYIRGMERGVKPPSAGARFGGQVGNVGAQGVGFLPDIMNAYALSRGGPISGSGQVLYPSEVTVSDGATYETAALEGFAKYHPMNAANNPDVTNRQRQEYIKNVMGKGEKNQWFNSDNDAWNQDLDDFVKRTGFTPEPMRGSQPVPQAILDAIRNQR
jgi:hypothetical protein